MNSRTLLSVVSSAALAFTLNASTYTSASYVQNGLIAQWDGIDNAGTGTHDPTTNVWKDLKGSLDMTLTSKGSWTSDGKALYVDGMGAQGASATPAYKTIEIVYKMTKDGGRLMFVSGLQSRFVAIDPASGTPKRIYFNGYGPTSGKDKYFNWPLDTTRIYSAAAIYNGDSNDSSESGSHVKDVYGDGVYRNDGTQGNGWGVGDGKVAVGDRTLAKSYPWTGNVYAIRLYDRELTMDEIAANRAIDVARFMAEEVEPLPIPEYVQDGLIVQWDAADNAGTGTHDPTATTWKDLKGSYDLTLTNNAAWNAAGNALVVDGVSAVNANTLPAYQTIEIVYKMTSKGGRIMFNSGDQNRMFIFDSVDSTRNLNYFSGNTKSGVVATKYFVRTHSSNEICFDAAVYDGGNVVASLFSDGRYGDDGVIANPWNPGPGVSIGGRIVTSSTTAASWYGEVYTIRLYNRRLTRAELAYNNRIDRRRFTSLENYEGRDSLIAQWDGEYNSGKGSAHDPNSTIWKDLRGTYDLTLTNNAAWNAAGNGLVVDGASAYNDYPAPVGKTFEIAYRKTNAAGRILFSCGNPSRQMVVSSGDGVYEYLSGLSGQQPRIKWSSFSSNAVRTVATTYTNTSTFAEFVYGDGTKRSDGTLNDSWSSNQAKLIIGDNKLTEVYRPWYGEVYAIRFYSTALTEAQIAANSALDKKRVAMGAKTVAWGGSDGDFDTKANWTGSALPRYMDIAEISSGTAAITSEQVVGSLTLGAGAALSLAVPENASAVPLTVLGGVTADATAGIVLDARAFGRKHAEESITLVECEKDSAAALQALADNLSFVNTGKMRQGVLAVVEGKKLVYTAPHKPGTTIIVQ